MGARAWPFWALFVFLVALHFLLRLGLGLGPIAPDLLVVALLLAARRVRPGAAAALGLGLGVLRDSLSLMAFGAHAVTLTLVGFLSARSRDFLTGESLLFIAAYLFLWKWVHDAIYYALTYRYARDEVVEFLVTRAPITAVGVAVAGVVAVLVLRAVEREA
jgi:rod shape-determining protein MreD